MDFFLVGACALVISAVSLLSGFGLGTLLMPVFALFFPIDLAIASTAVVHGSNSVIKAILLGRHADRQVVVGFGLPAIAAAFAGAWVLVRVSAVGFEAHYNIWGAEAVLTPVKVLMGLLMAGFAVAEIAPSLQRLTFPASYLPVGGLLSGFFGGLSGHQGALRSAFLARVGLSKEAFVGSNALVSLLVDLARLSAYVGLFAEGRLSNLQTPERLLVLTGVLLAFVGVLVGRAVFEKVTMKAIQRVTAAMLFVIAILLGLGLV